MSSLFTFLGIAGAIVIFSLYAFKMRSLSRFVEHPFDVEVHIAEGLQGGVFHDSSAPGGGWVKKSSFVRVRIGTRSKFHVTVLRQRELLGSSGKRYLSITGDEDFDRKLILLKASEYTASVLSENVAFRSLVLKYFLDCPELTQLKLRSGHVESLLINEGERVLEDPIRLKEVTAVHIEAIKSIRTNIE